MASSAMRMQTPLDVLDLDDLLAAIGATGRAYPMRHFWITALRAPHHRRHLCLHRAAPLPLALLRNFLFGYRHTSSWITLTADCVTSPIEGQPRQSDSRTASGSNWSRTAGTARGRLLRRARSAARQERRVRESLPAGPAHRPSQAKHRPRRLRLLLGSTPGGTPSPYPLRYR